MSVLGKFINFVDSLTPQKWTDEFTAQYDPTPAQWAEQTTADIAATVEALSAHAHREIWFDEHGTTIYWQESVIVDGVEYVVASGSHYSGQELEPVEIINGVVVDDNGILIFLRQ